ncbi:beta-phosphoglucomutase-like phosphatase (HAD superfamily) [Arthrobacter sp. OAP107]
MINDRVDLVVFDCDETLVDGEVLSMKVYQRVLADHVWNLSQEEMSAASWGAHRPISTMNWCLFSDAFFPRLGAQVPAVVRDAFGRELATVAGVEKAFRAYSWRPALPPTAVMPGSRKPWA